MKYTIIKKLVPTLLVAMALTISVAAADHSWNSLSNSNIISVSSIERLSNSKFNALAQKVKTDLEIAEHYAYLDISTASQAAQEIVLAARENIIYHSSWYDSEWCANAVLKDQDGNIVRELSAFQDMFPNDWEIPGREQPESLKLDSIQEADTSPRSYGYDLNARSFTNVEIPYANTSNVNYAEVVCKMTGDATVGQLAQSVPFNINFATTNMYDDTVAWITDVEQGYIFWTAGVRGYGYGMRVSTFEDNPLNLKGTFVVMTPEIVD